MNLFSVLEDIEKVDPEFQERISPRRDAIKNITSFGSKVAIAAMPFAISTLFKKAYGQSVPSGVADVLNFALKLEYLEAYFYNTGASTAALNIPGSDKPYLSTIQAHENEHVALLKKTLGAAAVSPSPQYDLTAGGTFADVLSNYDTFLAVGQAFEDTGVRAYKGQAPNLVGNQTFLTIALQIHSVEARHASAIRQLRNSRGANIRPWISGTAKGNDTGIPEVDGNYAGENNLIQGGVDITKLPGANGTTSAFAAVGGFDEPLTKEQVVALVAPFGVQ